MKNKFFNKWPKSIFHMKNISSSKMVLRSAVSSGKGSVPVMEVEPWTPTPDVQQVS
jgi:hypothetical protein